MTRFGNRKLQLIILLVLVSLVGTMSIAYAILSTTLNINGTAQVQDASWNVYFDNVQVNPGSVEINPVITDNNKVSFSADLTTPGEFYKFSVDIVNEGSIDAMIESIVRTPELTDDEKKYLRYEVEYVDGASINDSQLLKSSETKTISVLFSYRNDIPVSDLPTTETEFNLEIVLVYVQADSTGIEIPEGEKLVKIVSGDINTVGSEIAIGDEHFYLVKTENSKAILFTKYNLYVGSECVAESSADIVNCTAYGDSATGIQDENMIGRSPGTNVRTGTMYFAPVGYWNSYVNSYPAYVYNKNSTLYEYVENYKNYLVNLGLDVQSARLIKKEELEELGCSASEYKCINSQYSWIASSSYWTGTAQTEEGIWFVMNDATKTFSYNKLALKTNYGQFGVRPIIEISLSYF